MYWPSSPIPGGFGCRCTVVAVDVRLRVALRTLVVLVVLLAGLLAGARDARESRSPTACPPSLSTPGAPAPSCAGAADERRELLLTLVGGFLGAAVAIPATWPITRRRGDRFWAD